MVNKERVKQALTEVIDPEIGLDIVNLGLVYDIEVMENRVHVKMTLTVPGCPLGNFILSQAKEKVEEIDGVEEAEI